MSIESFIKKVCVQTAVYWGNPTPNGFGGYTFSAPVEVKCRWDDTNEFQRNANGVEFVAKAKVLVTQDMDLGGWLFLGSLDDLESNPVPTKSDGAFMIGKFIKVPMIKKTDVFVRTAFLSF